MSPLIEENPPAARNRGWVILVIAVLALGWTALGSALVQFYADREIAAFVDRNRIDAAQRADGLAATLRGDDRLYTHIVGSLAEYPTLRAAVLDPRVETRQQANSRLSDLVDVVDADDIFITDARGDIVAASDPDRAPADGFVAFDAFKSLAIHGRGLQLTVGGEKATPSLIYASGIYASEGPNRQAVRGGVVLRVELSRIFAAIGPVLAVLVDSANVIVAATDPAMLWHVVPPAAPPPQAQARYRHGTLSALEEPDDHRYAIAGLLRLPPRTEPFLQAAYPVGDTGLRLIYFLPLPDLPKLQANARLARFLVLTTGYLGLVVIVGGVISLVGSRRQVALLQLTNRKLSDFSEALEQEKQAALAATQAKSRFLATMSHELRTPFSGILGMVELLRSAHLDSEAREQVSLLERSARSLLRLLNDVLDFSKIEAGEMTAEMIVFDLRALTLDLVEMYRALATGKGVGIVVEMAPAPLFGLGDPTRVRQILTNYLSNAIKFSPRGSVLISLTVEGDGGTRSVYAKVVDHGPGIDPATQQKLFNPFVQGDASTTRKYGGTGLGLAICRRIAEILGGSVGVESAVGSGSTFWFRVPFPAVSQADVDRETRKRRGVDKLGNAGPPRHILLADDDVVNRTVISAMLKRAGHTVTAVVNGRQAVDAIRETRFDLVIMDMQMPELDGIDATRAVRSWDNAKGQVPIIGLTADAVTENRADYIGAGLNDLFTKPIRAIDLVEMVRVYSTSDDPPESRVGDRPDP